MRIENVVLENLNSLRGRFEIDLCDSAFSGGLFAIVGPSGAGKTTVLDAICLALYGQTPRVASVSDMQDEFMNKNADSCKAEVVFSARGKRYKALFVHERSKGSKPFRAAKRELWEQKSDGWHVIGERIREVDEKIKEVTGLDYSRFTRSIMLAQFRFAEFLQASSTARAEILEKITDMEIYRRISVAVFERTKQHRQTLESTQARIADTKVLSDEKKALLQDSQRTLGSLIDAHGRLAAALGGCAGSVRTLEALRTELTEHSNSEPMLKEAVLKAEDAFNKAAKQLESAQQAQESLALVIREVRALDHNISTQQSIAERLDKEIQQDDAQIRELKAAILSTFKKHYPNAQPEDYKELYESAKTGEKLRQAAKAELEDAKQQANGIRARMAEVLEGKDEEYWQMRQKALRVAVPLWQAREQLAQLQKTLAAQQGEFEKLSSQTKDIEKELQNAFQQYDQARLEQRFGDERQRLSDGQPCPLCGALHHPFADNEFSVNRFEGLMQAYEQAEKRQKQHLSLVIQVTTRIEELQKQADEKQQLIDVQTKLLEGLSGKEDADTQTLIKAMAKAENVLSEYSALVSKLSKAGELITALTERFSSVDKDIAVIEQQKQTIAKTLQRQATRSAEKHDALGTANTLAKKRAALFGDKDPDVKESAAAKHVKQALAQKEDCQKLREQAHRDADKNHADIVRLDSEIQRQTAVLEKTYSDVRDQAQAVKTAADADETVAEGVALYQTAAMQLAAKPDAAVLDAAAEALMHLISREEQHRGVISQILKADSESVDIKKSLEKQQAAQKQTLQKWEKLNALIGSADGAKLSRMAQSITFEVLLSHANAVLSRLSDRYILVRDEAAGAAKPLELAVADTYQAGEVRPVINLSGGESFIISLALALGLSEMSAGAARIDSLFIDEGFASLDESYMEAALQTLCALGSREGKLIGVISHVEALKERIDVQIEVGKLPGGRSTLSGPGVVMQALSN